MRIFGSKIWYGIGIVLALPLFFSMQCKKREMKEYIKLQEDKVEGDLWTKWLSEGQLGLIFRGESDIKIQSGIYSVRIKDEKDLRKMATGDFEIKIKRTHMGSEAGDTEEIFSAILFGREYFTKGTYGPYVRWDDTYDEPKEAVERVFLDTKQMLELTKQCADIKRIDGQVIFLKRGDECVRDDMVVLDVSGKMEDSPQRRLRLSLKIKVQSDGKVGIADISHNASLSDIPQDYTVTPPKEWIESRRERPIKMIENVLSGLVDQWGQGFYSIKSE